jgi:hypothetical protein
MSDVAENAGNILAGIEGVKKGLAELRRKIGDSENRSATERAAYAEAYRGAVREALARRIHDGGGFGVAEVA